MIRPTHAQLHRAAPGWAVPGPLALRLVLAAVLAVALSGTVAAWLVARASGQQAVSRVVSQQTDEVEVVARLLASKIEQSQKVLRTLASGITPMMLESPSSLEWLLQQGLPAVQFFDTMLVADANGELRLNLRAGHLKDAVDLDPDERDRYFTPRRLAELRLPGAPIENAVRRALRPAGGVGRIEEWRLHALGARRRAGRAWRAIRGR